MMRLPIILNILAGIMIILPPDNIVCVTFKIHSVEPAGFIHICEPEGKDAGGIE